ncbi:hypothetical protein LG3211_0672 [Lysobacter gummosus]|jgi:hypothetical protein|nr:hypothetical protein LG3211_0672 [Lysobacter gummosus]
MHLDNHIAKQNELRPSCPGLFDCALSMRGRQAQHTPD